MIFITGTSLIFIAACFKFYFDPDSLYKLMYDIIYCFSVCQIKFNKLLTFLDVTTSKKQLKQLKHYINGQIQENTVTNAKESNVRFIALTLSYNGDKYPIVLIDSNYNFYAVGNTLDKKFFHYYLTNILCINAPLDESFTYKLEIIDNNVNIQIINDTKTIVFNEDDYLII